MPKTIRTSSGNFQKEGTEGANKRIKFNFISNQENANKNQHKMFYTRLAKLKCLTIAKITEDTEYKINHFWWECKDLKPLCIPVWRQLSRYMKMCVYLYTQNPTPRCILRKTLAYVCRERCTQVFSETLSLPVKS